MFSLLENISGVRSNNSIIIPFFKENDVILPYFCDELYAKYETLGILDISVQLSILPETRNVFIFKYNDESIF